MLLALLLLQDAPETRLGFRVGDDFKLARWGQIVDYFKHLDDASPRVTLQELGKSTLGAPYVLAVISSEENLARLDRIKEIQRRLADPRGLEDEKALVEESRAVIVVTCGLHSSEVASPQMAMEMAYELATSDDPRFREIREQCVIVLVPSANPDGVDLIAEWYDSTIGTPWEGGAMPWLYHPYVGHDNNRDWFMLTQKETRLLTRALYEEWFPVILYDIHQMGNEGARFFVPPFFDPVNPNVHPLIHQQLAIVGGHMATEFAEAGRQGVITHAIYDNWWHGGNRTTPYRHNITGILTEAASARLASPVFQKKEDLKGHERGLPEYRLSANFVDPWPGGWWRLRDIVEYEKIACMALFTLAARYRETFNANYVAVARDAVRLGTVEPPAAFLVPPDQRDPVAAAEMLQILRLGGVEVHRATSALRADGIDYPAGTYVVQMAQPYRNHAKDLLERQTYPHRLQYKDGPPEAPYDAAGWTLPLQMGARIVAVEKPFEAALEAMETIEPPAGTVTGSGEAYRIAMHTNDDFVTVNRALKAGVKIYRDAEGVIVREPPADRGRSTSLVAIEKAPEKAHLLRAPRTALYQPWTASMDEGWTRWVLERYKFPYATIHDADVRAGTLPYDAVIIPDLGLKELIDGRAPDSAPAKYVGGIGDEGAVALLTFVREGGTLILFDSACELAIEKFKAPVKNVLAGVERKDFFCPGSILRIDADAAQPVAWGAPAHTTAYFARSTAFEKEERESEWTVTEVAHYSNTVLLESGWIVGEEKIKGKAAVVDLGLGAGRIVMIGFRPQHRGQPQATFRFVFNAVLRSVAREEDLEW